MEENEKKIEEKKEDVPTWATKLQETLDDLPSRLKEAMTPEPSDPSPQQSPEEITEIPLPEIPQPETPEQESPTAEPLEEEKPKKKRSWREFFL